MQPTQSTPAQVDAHLALDRAMETFAPLEDHGPVRLYYRDVLDHALALLDLHGSPGITVEHHDAAARPETLVQVRSDLADIALSWTANAYTGADNGWKLDSVPHPGVSTWPGRRYRKVLAAFDTLRPLSAMLPPEAVADMGVEEVRDPGEAADRVRSYALYKGGRTGSFPSDMDQWPDVREWMGVARTAAAAVLDAQPWGEGELDAVVRPILDRAWPVAAR